MDYKPRAAASSDLNQYKKETSAIHRIELDLLKTCTVHTSLQVSMGVAYGDASFYVFCTWFHSCFVNSFSISHCSLFKLECLLEIIVFSKYLTLYLILQGLTARVCPYS